MPTPKQKIIKLVEALPDDCSMEEALDRLFILYKVERGRASSKIGPNLPHDQVMKEMREWVMRSSGRRPA
ncbi:MAG TPA: hypothetical protein VEJ63_17725, partial [Planctomycetota bacterium]|nr:hypothetical protein [Planctomycetota bacterium]